MGKKEGEKGGCGEKGGGKGEKKERRKRNCQEEAGKKRESEGKRREKGELRREGGKKCETARKRREKGGIVNKIWRKKGNFQEEEITLRESARKSRIKRELSR